MHKSWTDHTSHLCVCGTFRCFFSSEFKKICSWMSPLHGLTKLHMLKLHMILKNGPVPGTLKKEADFQNLRNYVSCVCRIGPCRFFFQIDFGFTSNNGQAS